MSFRDEVWSTLSATRNLIPVLTAFLLFLFGLTVVSFWLGHQRSSTTVVAYANLVITGGGALASVGLYRYLSDNDTGH